jgi:hypothetical protein
MDGRGSRASKLALSNRKTNTRRHGGYFYGQWMAGMPEMQEHFLALTGGNCRAHQVVLELFRRWPVAPGRRMA